VRDATGAPRDDRRAVVLPDPQEPHAHDPIVEGQVTESLLATAREAVRMCPRLALRLVDPR
jgi:ferredoxin